MGQPNTSSKPIGEVRRRNRDRMVMMYDVEKNEFRIEHFTEGEIAHYLQLWGINKLGSKDEKLRFARERLKPLITQLWAHAQCCRSVWHKEKEAGHAERLAAKLDSLIGLMAVIKLAAVSQ